MHFLPDVNRTTITNLKIIMIKRKIRYSFGSCSVNFLLSTNMFLDHRTDPCGCLLLVFVHVYVKAGGEEFQLCRESLIHGHHLILLFEQRRVVSQQAHAERQRKIHLYLTVDACVLEFVCVFPCIL